MPEEEEEEEEEEEVKYWVKSSSSPLSTGELLTHKSRESKKMISTAYFLVKS